MSKKKTSREHQFKFARRIKTIARSHDIGLTPRQHVAIYELWHSRNQAFLTPGVDYFSEYLARMSAVRFGDGEKLEAAYQRALIATPTARVLIYRNEAAHTLANLCRELQLIAGDRAFFLGCRAAAKLMSVHWTTVAEWLSGFQPLGIIRLIERGMLRPGEKANRASYYRYTAEE